MKGTVREETDISGGERFARSKCGFFLSPELSYSYDVYFFAFIRSFFAVLYYFLDKTG